MAVSPSISAGSPESRRARSWRAPVASLWRAIAAAAGLAALGAAHGAVQDVVVTDVTTRAFAVVWASDEPVATATLRIFSDVDGLNEITSQFSLQTISSAQALAQGVVKVDAVGLNPGDTVYVRTETESVSGQFVFPAAPPLLPLTAALVVRKANDLDAPITNDLILHPVLAPDQVTPADGALVVVNVPSVSEYPLTSFTGDGIAVNDTVVDLNNLFETGTRQSADLAGNEALRVIEYRGLLCAGLGNHQQTRWRRVPLHEEAPPITQLETAPPCFLTDTVCDETINILDVQFVLNSFGATPGDCRFNPDLNIVDLDGDVINILDVQDVLNDFGNAVPPQ